MCGIAGAIGTVDADAVDRMHGAMVHRGPDQSGRWRSGAGDGHEVLFAHRRLSIIDLSDAGRQPMVDGKTGVAMVYNGECFNYRQLASELAALGREPQGHSDSEVVLLACAQWGEDAIARLHGQFALAVWDPRREELLLARDRLGIKPLYWTRRHGRLTFASELRALLASGDVDRRIDPASMASYVWHGFVPGPATIARDVELLEPGSAMRVRGDGTVAGTRRYWQRPRAVEPESQAEVRVGEALARAVSERLVSDVPLGVFLSGGVDSSAVAAFAQAAGEGQVRTFNIRFEEAEYDESRFARAVAKQLGTEHEELILSQEMFAEHLDDALAACDQPTFDAINTYFVSRAVREAGLTVALAGTGGDELFGGYSSFVDLPRAQPIARVAGRLPPSARQLLSRATARALMGPAHTAMPPQTRWGKLEDLLATQGDLAALYQVSYALFTREVHGELVRHLHADLEFGLRPAQLAALRAEVRGQPVLPAVSTLELASFLTQRLLRDTDAAAMAVSLEVRVPLLDHRVLEALAAVPVDRRYRPLGRKTMLKQAFARHVDPSVFDRPKAGFELPLQQWCRARLSATLDDTLLDADLAARIGLDGRTIARVWRAFQDGAPGLYWSRIWALFALMRWCRDHDMKV